MNLCWRDREKLAYPAGTHCVGANKRQPSSSYQPPRRGSPPRLEGLSLLPRVLVHIGVSGVAALGDTRAELARAQPVTDETRRGGLSCARRTRTRARTEV